VHYWVLQACEKKMLAKEAAAEVSRHWGITPLRVQKIARKVRTIAEVMLKMQPHEETLQWVESTTPPR
jgi:hypothetical protein